MLPVQLLDGIFVDFLIQFMKGSSSFLHRSYMEAKPYSGIWGDKLKEGVKGDGKAVIREGRRERYGLLNMAFHLFPTLHNGVIVCFLDSLLQGKEHWTRNQEADILPSCIPRQLADLRQGSTFL